MNKIALLLILASFGALAAPRCDVRYEFAARWNDKPRHFDVTLTFDAGSRSSTHVRGTSSWAGVSNFGDALRNVDVKTAGATLATDGIAMHWTVAHPATGPVEVRYQVFNGVANVDAETPIDHRDTFRNLLGEKFFNAFGHGLFLIPEEASPPGTEYCITFTNLPGSWSFVSSFGADQEPGRVAYVVNAGSEAIRHAVFLGGDFRVLRRDIEGRPLYVALRGSWQFEDAKFVEATARLIETQRRFFNDFDYPHFLVSLLPNRVAQGSTGGTAVYNAFAMHAAKDFTVPGRSFEYLIGHEHLHTWVPTRMGTMGAEGDDPTRYWFSEGFTDYLTHRLLLRSGTWSLGDYAAGLSRVMERYLASPALTVPNARVAKEFFSNREVGQIPYMRGELLALRWDGALRQKGATMDGVLKSLVLPRDKMASRDSKDPANLAVTRLDAALAAYLGPDLDADLAEYIEHGEIVPVGPEFLGPCFAGTIVSKPRFELGFDNASVAAKRIQGVVAGGSAERAGVKDGMELAGWSIYFGDTNKEVTLQVREEGNVRELTFRPVAAKPVDVPVFGTKPGAAEDAACRAWIAG